MLRVLLVFVCVLGLGVHKSSSQDYLRMMHSSEFSVNEIIQNAESYFENRDKGRGSGYKQFKRWEFNARRLQNEEGFLPTTLQRINTLQDYNAQINQSLINTEMLNDSWEELGPLDFNSTTGWNPGVGRITSISEAANNVSHIIAGANTGGVWRTLDGGSSWTPLTDTFTNLRVYSVAIDPNNDETYYFGSSDGVIFKSEDSGATWTMITIGGDSVVNTIVVHPTNPNIIFATVQYDGVYRSTNGGDSWTQVTNDSAGYDVEILPNDPQTVFVSGNLIHKSTDGGFTFNEINGLPFGPKMIGISAQDTSKIYVLLAEISDGTFGGIFRSNDTGQTFVRLNHGTNNYFGYSLAADDNAGQAPRDMDIVVNPQNADEVHIASILTWRSLDGGNNFSPTSDWLDYGAVNNNVGYCHADVDMMKFIGPTLYVATDGGIFKAENTETINSSYYTDLTTGMGIRQFYEIGVAQTQSTLVTGGSQDNGTSFYTEANGWKDWLGADGMSGFIDLNDTNIMYGTIQHGRIYKTIDGGNTIINMQEPGQGFGNFVTPYEQDRTVVNTAYIGYDQVYKTTNGGDSWTSISQRLAPGFNIDNLEISASNNNILFASVGSNLYRSLNGGSSNWSIILSTTNRINSIAIHPTIPNLVAIAVANSNKVLVSTDGGETWNNYAFNLPDFSALSLVWDDNGKNGLYLGMDYGVYYIDNTFTEWQPYSTNLPNVIINELEINNEQNKLYAATYGRGLWATALVPDGLLGIEGFNFSEALILSPNPAINTITLTFTASYTEAINIEIYDVLGKQLIKQKQVYLNQGHTLDVTSLKSGTYFARVETKKGTVTKRFIKQ